MRRFARFRSTITMSAIASLVLTAIVTATPASARQADRSTPARSPFTAAAVTRESSATWRVSWSAPSSPFVLVFAGSRPGKLDRFVTVGRQRGAITVHDRRREWFTLIPAHGARLSIIERDLGLASDPNL